MSPVVTILFAAGAAFFYMAASWMMKAWGASPYLVLAPVVLTTLAVGAWFETEVLRSSRLGFIIVLVLALEILMTFAVAVLLLGEAYTMREIMGVLVVFTGIVLLAMPPAAQAD